MGMPNRLSHFDYSQPGYYFITICTKNHHSILRRGAQCAPAPLPPLTSAGLAAERFLLEIPVHYPMISVDHYVVMPNHVHLILVITAGHIGTDGRTMCAPTVSRVVRGWKEAVTKQIGVSIWQNPSTTTSSATRLITCASGIISTPIPQNGGRIVIITIYDPIGAG